MATKKKTTTTKVAAKKPAVKKAVVAKKAPAKKTAAVAKPAPASSAAAKKPAPKKTAEKRTPNAAFMKAMQPSPELSEVVGSKPIPRTEVTKKIWDYIKKNKLQDALNRRMINADDKLRTVFGGKKQVSMFEMTKLVNTHLS